MSTSTSARRKGLAPLRSVQTKTDISPKLKIPRSTFTEASKNKNQISMNELIRNKQKKQQLLENKTNIIAKIARYEQLFTYKPKDKDNVRILKVLKPSIAEVKRDIRQRKRDIKRIRNSDITASITENQEEIKMLHLEIVRLNEEKHKVYKEIDEAQANLDELISMYAPRRMRRSKQNISELREKIRETEQAIDIIEHPEKYFASSEEESKRKKDEEQMRKELISLIKKTKKQRIDEENKIREIENELYSGKYENQFY